MNNTTTYSPCACGSGKKTKWCCGKTPTKDDVKKRGMVFTPPELVNQMLDRMPTDTFLNADKTILEPACGTGNFLVEILSRRMKAGISHLDSLKTMYGIDIVQENIDICHQRLSLGSTDEDIWFWLKLNIVCANTLDEKHPGWNRVGYMWQKVKLFKMIAPDAPIKEFDNFIIVGE